MDEQMERVAQLEGRVGSVENTVASHSDRLESIEGKLVDVRIGMAQLHGDLKLNNQTTEHISQAVSKIQSDTSEMIAVYRATPRIKQNIRWWWMFAGAMWAAIMAGATVVGALK